MLGGGISSKMNVYRLSAVELTLQLKVSKTATYIAEENNYVNVKRPCPWLFDLKNMVAHHQQNHQPGVTDWSECAPESAKFVSTSRTGSNVCTWWGSYSKGKSFYYLFHGFIACLNIPITHEWVESSYECLRTHPNRLRFSYNVQECIRNLLRIKHDFSNRGIRGQVLNSSFFLSQIPIGLQIARTDYGLYVSVKIFPNWVRLSPRIQIFVNSWRFVGFRPCV